MCENFLYKIKLAHDRPIACVRDHEASELRAFTEI